MENEIYYNESVIDNLKEMYEKIKLDNEKINLINIEIDNKIQDIVHYIELKVFNVPEGYFAVKDIKILLKEKRANLEAKKEILSLIDFFDGKIDFSETCEVLDGLRFTKKCVKSSIVKKVKGTSDNDYHLNTGDLLSQLNPSESFAIALAEMLREYDNRRESLRENMSAVEKKINLLLSRIEFSDFGLIEGYRIAKQLKELRMKRRKIKDEFNRFTYLDEILLNNTEVKASVESLRQEEGNKTNRKYTPRVLKSFGVMTS